MENPENKNGVPEEKVEGAQGTDQPEEMSVLEFVREGLSAAKSATADAVERAKSYVQEQADSTDLDEKAKEFARKAADTAKEAASTAAEKTKELLDSTDLDEKAIAFAKETAAKAKSLGASLLDKAKEAVEDVKKHLDD